MYFGEGGEEGRMIGWEGIETENTEFHPLREGKDVTGNCGQKGHGEL